MITKNPDTNIHFLAGGGEMGQLTRDKDWSKTSIGSPQFWPQSLRITLNLILNSKFPMFLWWGPELICFYNDAYRPSLGENGKHPSILGMNAKEAWEEIWHIIKPLIDQVLTGGEAVWNEDMLVPIYRNGILEDVYWTFGYSPVNDESDKVFGVLVTCTETTKKVIALQQLEESKNQLEFAIEATELGTWDYNPLTNKFSSNEQLKKWFGLAPGEQIELTYAVNAMLESDKQKVTGAIQRALEYSSGGHYDIEYTIVHPVSKKETIVHAKGRAWFNDEKIAYRFNGTLEDITEQAIARRKIEESQKQAHKELADTYQLHKISTRLIYEDKVEVLYQEILEAAKAIMNADCASLQLLNPDKNELILLAWKGFHPESARFWSTVCFGEASSCGMALKKGERIIVTDIEPCDFMAGTKDLESYRLSGIRAVQSTPLISRNGNVIGMISTHWSQIHQPSERELQLFDVLARQATDLIERKQAEQKLTESENELQSLFMQSPAAIAMLKGPQQEYVLANSYYQKLFQRTAKQLLGKTMREVFPEVEGQDVFEMMQKVYESGKTFAASEFPAIWDKENNGIFKKGYFNFSVQPIKDANGKVNSLVIIAYEVTDHIEARKKIEESEQRYRELSLSLEDKVRERTFQLMRTNQTFQYAEQIGMFGSYRYNFNTQQLTYSDNLYRIIGCEPNEFPSAPENFIKFIHQDDVQYVLNATTEAFTDKHTSKWEYRLIRKDGKQINVRGTGKLITDDENVQWMIGTLQDITEEKTRENILKESQDKFNSLFQFSPFSITLSEIPSGEFVDVNENFINTFEFTREELIGKTSLELNLIDEQVREKILQSLKEHGTVKNVEVEITKKAGDKIPVLISIETVIINDKEYYLNAINDIIERKKSEEKIEQKNAELEKMNKELQTFAYISSHDLQEPLRKIQTFASRILEKEGNNLSDNGKDNFNRMQVAAERMQTLIGDLLAYSRTNTEERKFEKIDLNQIVTEVKEDFSEELKNKNAIIETDTLCEASIIPFQFRQLMHNLIGNSLKFSNPEKPAHIKIKSKIASGIKLKNEKLSPQKQYCHISISDNGIGFEPQYSEKIFEVFQRLHGKSEYNGTGIGLAIVKKIVDNHHGIITANSEPDKGATFDIYIPA